MGALKIWHIATLLLCLFAVAGGVAGVVAFVRRR